MIASVFQAERWTQPSPPRLVPENLTTTPASLPPDIMLVLDDDKTTKFFAHRFVLAYHSGYFRTLFASFRDFEVHVSNVDPAIFSVLLNYMYTGQLHVNADNVYDLLIASNLLYLLPIADLCRGYLRESVDSAKTSNCSPSASVIKPVPRRNPAILPTTPTLKYQPLRTNNYDASSIFKPVNAKSSSSSSSSSSPPPGPSSPEKVEETAVDDNGSDSVRKNEGTKTIYDIACCDGPIKFRKVVNQFYKPWKTGHEVVHAPSSSSHERKVVAKSGRGAVRLRQSYSNAAAIDDNATSCSNHSHEESANAVQYYPCKNCGSKFPSYYFVNKHRKLCHANESGGTPSTVDD